MFGWFKKKKTVAKIDKVWMERKYVPTQLHIDFISKIQAGEKVFICSFFEDVYEYFVAALKKIDPSFETYVFIHPSNLFNPSFSTQVKTELMNGKKVYLFFTGHYPMPDKENEMLEKLNTLHEKNKPVFEFYISLEDEIFTTMEDKIKSLLLKLGGKPDEMISHSMISTSIARLQKKIQNKVITESRTRNEKEWYQRNNVFQ